MKKVLLTSSSILAMAFSAVAADLTTQLVTETDCKTVAQLVTNALGDKTDNAAVSSVLSTALKAKSGCACEIVTATIEATGAAAKDKASLIEAIVETAITALPEQTATIAECAVAAAPNHSALIDKTLTRVFSDKDKKYLGEGSSKNGYSEKNGYGKDGEGLTTVDPGEGGEGLGGWPVALPAPVYLIAPSGGISSSVSGGVSPTDAVVQ